MSTHVAPTYSVSNCEDEPIHIPESIQPYGYLIAVDPDSLAIQIISENVLELFDVTISTGKTKLSDLAEINTYELQSIYSRLVDNHQRQPYHLHLNSSLLNKAVNFKTSHCVCYRSGDYLVLEIEPEDSNTAGVSYLLPDYTQALPNLHTMHSVEEVADLIANAIKQLTAFDRVMVYKFDDKYNGRIIGERREAHLEAFLDMQFPAADIPKQARRLYELNRIRIISNIDNENVLLKPSIKEAQRRPLDLSASMVRSVSPIHIEYLRNMGVQATMSISLMNGDSLWGLVACHHYSEHYIPQTIRLACESLGQIYSWQLNAKEYELHVRIMQKKQRALDSIISDMSQSKSDVIHELKNQQATLLSMMNACGFAIIFENTTEIFGQAPDDQTMNTLIDALSNNGNEHLMSTNKLTDIVDDSGTLNAIAGAMVLRLSQRHDYFVLWFREPVTYTINWAGKDAVLNTKQKDEHHRLSPRGSFSLWVETVKNECAKWSEEDQLIAERFNYLFMTFVIEKKIAAEKNIERLKQLDRAKDQFLASISHELRSPLNSIVGWTDLALVSTQDEHRTTEALEVIKRSATMQAELIDDLLDVSRITAGTLKLNVQSTNLASIIRDVCSDYRVASEAKNITIATKLDDSVDTILGDEIRLKQIISNLVNNALKFTAKGGRITITGYRQDSNYIVAVRDNGVGISKDTIDHIFDHFYQPNDDHRKRGLGLGLAIVKHLTELHGATIKAESPGEDKGSTFTLNFPISPLALNGNDENKGIWEEDNAAYTDDKQRLQGIRILVVEDEDDARRFISLFLQSQGAEVRSTRNGLEAIEALEDKQQYMCDVVLSDIGMPDMDGYELIKNIRNHPKHQIRRLQVIALTAYAYTKDRVKALKSGFNSYIPKPVNVEELVTVIETSVIREKELDTFDALV